MRRAEQTRIIVGIGNAERGDDAAGLAVARLLRARLADVAPVVERDGDAGAILECLEGRARAILIDACRSGAAPGTIRRWVVGERPLPELGSVWSTHGLGLGAAIELARALKALPRRCVVYGIEGESFDPGAPLSRPVAAAISAVADRIAEEIRSDHDG